MRIAWLIFGSLDQHTGGYLYDRHAIVGLRRAGHEVIVISADEPRGDAAARASGEVVAARILAARAEPGGLTMVVEDELCHPILPTLHERLRHALGSSCPPIVMLVHHLQAWEQAAGSPAPATEIAALHGASVWIATSRHSRQRLVAELGLPEDRVFAIVPGVDEHALAGPVSRRPGALLRLLFVGHLTVRKGLLDLVVALAKLDPTRFHLDIIGELDRDPSYRERVKQTIAGSGLEGQITLHGPLPSVAVAEYLATSDVVVVPSHYEGYGIVLGEAQFQGTPVLACRVGAVPEVVADGVSGLLVPAHAPAALAAALLRLMSEPGLLASLADGARRQAASGALSRWATVGEELCAVLARYDSPARG